MRVRPPGEALMTQKWRDLLFLHAPIDPAKLRPLLPDGLEIDLYPDANGELKAWVGVVLFHMRDITPLGLPPAPFVSAFPEFNVRTYVHREGKEPGVWFFSLDAALWLAVEVARTWYSLPYVHARMDAYRMGNEVRYWSRRMDEVGEVEAWTKVGEPLGPAAPGTFDHWLVERYALYAQRGQELGIAQVFHEPYPLRKVEAFECAETLTQSNGIGLGPWSHVAFSDGVDVEVFGIRNV